MRNAIEQSCDVYFYTRRQHARRSTGSTSGRRGSASASSRASTCRTSSRASCRRPSGRRKRVQREVVSRARRSRSSIGQGQVNVTSMSLAVYDGDAGERRHARDAASRARRSTTERVEAGAAAGDRSRRSDVKPSTCCRRFSDGMWMVVNARRHGRARPHRGQGRRGKTGTAQVISLQGAKAARGAHRSRPPRSRLVHVLRAARQSGRSPASIFAEHGNHGYLGGADREAHHRDLLRQEGGPAAAAAADARSRRAWRVIGRGRRRRPASSSASCSNGGCTSTSTGCSWRRSSRCAGSAWR